MSYYEFLNSKFVPNMSNGCKQVQAKILIKCLCLNSLLNRVLKHFFALVHFGASFCHFYAKRNFCTGYDIFGYTQIDNL